MRQDRWALRASMQVYVGVAAAACMRRMRAAIGTVAFAPCAACVLRSSAQCGTRVLLWERCVPTLGHQRHREWDMGGQEGQQR